MWGLRWICDGLAPVRSDDGLDHAPLPADALLLIDPKAASAFAHLLAEEEAKRDANAKGEVKDEGAPRARSSGADNAAGGGSFSGSGEPRGSGAGGGLSGGGKPPAAKKTVFFGQVELDPVRAKLQFSDVAEEVLMLFTSKPGVKVKVSLEIQAEAASGFDESTQRAARENCNQLKFKNHGFDE